MNITGITLTETQIKEIVRAIKERKGWREKELRRVSFATDPERFTYLQERVIEMVAILQTLGAIPPTE